MKRSLFLLVFGLALTSVVLADEGEFIYNDHGSRDPFWPLVTAGGALVSYESNFSVDEMTLEGTIEDGSGGLAIINGTVVEVGKRIGEYTVQKISPNGVVLEKDGQTTEIRLKKEE
jgi:hypothetical protein